MKERSRFQDRKAFMENSSLRTLLLLIPSLVACVPVPRTSHALVNAEPTESEAHGHLPDPALSPEEAIVALEEFIARYPSGPETQEARFRLAVLYLAREIEADAGSDDPPGVLVIPSRDDSIRVLQEYLAVQGPEAVAGVQRADAALLLGTCFWDTDDVAQAVHTWRAVVCPEWGANTTYATCHPIARGRAIGAIWGRLGSFHFLESEFDLAAQAFEYASEVGEPSVRQHALYMRGWLSYGHSRYQEALEVLARVLESDDGTSVDLSLGLSGDALVANDWDRDSLPDQESVVSRCRRYAQAHRNLERMPQVILLVVDILIDQTRYPEARAVLSIAPDYPERFEGVDIARRQETLRQRTP